MGWCSGTNIFDPVASKVIDNPNIPLGEQVRIVTALYRACRDEDWDCEGDSEFYNHPVFITAEYIVEGEVSRYSEATEDEGDEYVEDADASGKVLMEFVPPKKPDEE